MARPAIGLTAWRSACSTGIQQVPWYSLVPQVALAYHGWQLVGKHCPVTLQDLMGRNGGMTRIVDGQHSANKTHGYVSL